MLVSAAEGDRDRPPSIIPGIAGFAEAADQDDSTVLDYRDGVLKSFNGFINH